MESEIFKATVAPASALMPHTAAPVLYQLRMLPTRLASRGDPAPNGCGSCGTPGWLQRQGRLHQGVA